MKFKYAAVMLALSAFQCAQASVTLRVADGAQQQDVTLAGSFISVTAGQERTVYDFQQRRRIAIDVAARTYVSYALSDTLKTRWKKLNAQKTTTDLEHAYSLAHGAAISIEESAAGDLREFSSGGVKLAAWSTRGVKVDPADAAQFAQLLRYTRGGHPQLLAKLSQESLIPERLVLYLRTAEGSRTVNLSITAVQPAVRPAYDLNGYAHRRSKDGVDAVLDWIGAATPEQVAAWRAAHPCVLPATIEPGGGADYILAEGECVGMNEGKDTKPTTKTNKALAQALAKDPTSMLFFNATLEPGRSPEGDLKAVAELRAAAPRRIAIVNIFEAGYRARQGQVKEGVQLLVQALQANPLYAPAYKELAELLEQQGDVARAALAQEAYDRLMPYLDDPRRKQKTTEHNPEYF